MILRTLRFFKLSGCFFALLTSTAVLTQAREPVKTGAENDYNKGITVSPLLVTSTTADGAPIVYPETDTPEVRVLLIEVPPGAETGWHTHPMPCYGYILSGSITVELADGTKHTFTKGQALAEIVNTAHNGKNTGTEPTRILMTVISSKGVPITKPAAAPDRAGKEEHADHAGHAH